MEFFDNLTESLRRIVIVCIVGLLSFWILAAVLTNFLPRQLSGLVYPSTGVLIAFYIYQSYKQGTAKTFNHLLRNKGMTLKNTPQPRFLKAFLDETQGSLFERYLAQIPALSRLHSMKKSGELTRDSVSLDIDAEHQLDRHDRRDKISRARISNEFTDMAAKDAQNFGMMQQAGWVPSPVIREQYKSQDTIAQEETKILARNAQRETLLDDLRRARTRQERESIMEEIKALDDDQESLSG